MKFMRKGKRREAELKQKKGRVGWMKFKIGKGGQQS
jgi:hypothetical protein